MTTIYDRMQALYQLSNWLSGERRDEDRRQMYVRRRRAWLWRPLMLAGLALLVWQISTWQPVYLLVWVGLGMCVPWVADV